MAWPNVSEYQDAVLNLQLNIDDLELKAGKPELDAQGFPRPRSGQFACVFRIQSGQKDWAIKCFTQEVKDLQDRYTAIDQYLSLINLPYMVAFAYLPIGIKVRGQWYPILKMEWVHGELLSHYIEHHLNNSADLQQLALRWLDMIKTLQAKSIAHGDLQERNVLVVNGTLKLVDYDGMFVPALSGRISHELGHRNYQHPQRTETDFGSYLDHFSAWVIYVSIVVLSIDPSLWTRAKAGDECLLFRRSDFDQPTASPTMALLEHHSNPNVRTLESLFRSILYFPPQQVPSLDGKVPPLIQGQASHASPQVDWWSDHVSAGQQKSGNVAATLETSFQSASWVLDFVCPNDKVSARGFSQSPTQSRFIALFSVNILLLALVGGILLPILFPYTVGSDSLYWIKLFLGLFVLSDFLVLTGLVVTRYYYRKDPAVIEKWTFGALEANANEALKNLETMLSNNAKDRETIQAEENQRRRKIDTDLARLREREKRENDDVQATLKKTIASIESRRRALDQDELSRMGTLRADIGAKVNSLNNQIASLASLESTEIARELTTLQNRHIENYLKNRRITEAPLAGLRYTSRSNLEQALYARGIYTAYDISYSRVDAVYGFGPKRTQTLVNWRNQIEQQARFTMPRDINPDAKNAIRSKYVSQKDLLERQRDIEQAKFLTEEKSIRDRVRQGRQTLESEESTVQTQAVQRIQGISRRYAQEAFSHEQALAQLTKEFDAKQMQIDEHTKQIRQQMFSASWQIAKLNHEYQRYGYLSYFRYLKTVFLGERSQ